ncbi:MAG: serine hydrolase [Acidobacteria bacterium]|nr:serine hydrolase [Acidobacteriota bacterium]
MKKFAASIVFLIALAAVTLGQDAVATLDKYIQSSMKDWRVPGLSIAVVKDGKVLLSKGYGVKTLGKEDPVDNKTLFGCMSTTKAFTAVGLGILVDEGKLGWDDKVTKWLPDFRLSDSYITADLRVRDLLTHNSGIGNTDLLWAWDQTITPAEIYRRMQLAKPEYPLRGGFIYQNVMYLLAGMVLERASGMTWERFITERIFRPLGMNDTYATLALSRSYGNRSTPHFDVEGKIINIPETEADPIAPAGAIWSNSDDIAKWVTYMLSNKTPNGTQIIKPATYAELFKPQVIVPPTGFYPTIAVTKPHWMTYGLGWFQHDYRGEMIDFHTGSLDGRTAIIGLMPDKKVGVYIFGNLDHAELRHALMYKVFDLFAFNDDSRDWSADLRKLYGGIKDGQKKQEDSFMATRKIGTQPSLPLGTYVGRYSDPFYGKVEVILADGKLKLLLPDKTFAVLDVWQFDAFEATWSKPWWGHSFAQFAISPLSPSVDSVTIDGALFKKEAEHGK